MVPLVVYSDQTNVSIIGNKKYHPVYITVANISAKLRKKEIAWRLLGYIPILDETLFTGGKPSSKALRTQNFQESLKIMLSSATDLTLR